MKTKVLNTLIDIREVFLYVLISGIILEVIILIFPVKQIVAIKNFMNIYNYVLAVIATLFLFGMIFLPLKKKEPNVPNKKIYKNVKGTWVFKFRGLEFSIRFLVFAGIGFLAGIYFLSSFIVFDIDNSYVNFLIPLVLLFFGIFYPLAYFVLLFIYEYMIANTLGLMLNVFGVEKKVNEREEFYKRLGGGATLGFDIISYYIGGFAGLCFVGLIAVLVAIIWGGILLGKGIIWLIHNPNPWGILVLSVIGFFVLVYFSYKKSMGEIDGYLKDPENTFNF